MKEYVNSIIKLIRFLLFIWFIYWYCKTWFNSLKEGKLIKFLLMSILPAFIIYYAYFEIVFGHPPPGMDNPYMSYDDY